MRKNWDRIELLICLATYLKLPFYKGRVPTISEVTTLIPRNYSSVSIRLANFAACDPSARARGVNGMAGGLAVCKPIWDEFCNNHNKLLQEINGYSLYTNNTIEDNSNAKMNTPFSHKEYNFAKFELILLLYLLIKRIPCNKGSHIIDFFSLFFNYDEDAIEYALNRFKDLISSKDTNLSDDIFNQVWFDYKSNSSSIIFSGRLFWDYILTKSVNVFPEKQFATKHIVSGKLESIEADDDVENLVDILLEKDCSLMNIISDCMNKFGEKYSHMSLKDWKLSVSNYIEQSKSVESNDTSSVVNQEIQEEPLANDLEQVTNYTAQSVEEPKISSCQTTLSKSFNFAKEGKTIASNKCLDNSRKLKLPNFVDYRNQCRDEIIKLYNQREYLQTIYLDIPANLSQKDIEKSGKYKFKKWNIEFFICERRKCIEDSGIVRTRQYIYYPIVDKIFLCDDVYTGLKPSIKSVLDSLFINYSSSDFDKSGNSQLQATSHFQSSNLSMKAVDVLKRTTEELKLLTGEPTVLNYNTFTLKDFGNRGIFKFSNAILKIILVKGVIENSGIKCDTYYMQDTISNVVVSFGSITTARQRIESAIKRAYKYQGNNSTQTTSFPKYEPKVQPNNPICNYDNFVTFLSQARSSQGYPYSESSIKVYTTNVRSNYIIKKVLRYRTTGDIFDITDIETAKLLLSDIEYDYRNNKAGSANLAVATLYIRFLEEFVFANKVEDNQVNIPSLKPSDDRENRRTETTYEESNEKNYIRVTYLDGTIDEQLKVVETLINFVQRVGVTKVYELHLKYYGGDLVCPRKDFVPKYETRYRYISNNLFINTNTNTQTKFSQMREIAKLLNFNCRIELMKGYTIIDTFNNL